MCDEEVYVMSDGCWRPLEVEQVEQVGDRQQLLRLTLAVALTLALMTLNDPIYTYIALTP